MSIESMGVREGRLYGRERDRQLSVHVPLYERVAVDAPIQVVNIVLAIFEHSLASPLARSDPVVSLDQLFDRQYPDVGAVEGVQLFAYRFEL